MNQTVNPVGRHYILDFWEAENLTDVDLIESALIQAAENAGATVLHTHIHPFPGGGATGVVLLAESHISIHTWPEIDYAAIDIFLCGDSVPQAAIDVLEAAFAPKRKEVKLLNRGDSAE